MKREQSLRCMALVLLVSLPGVPVQAGNCEERGQPRRRNRQRSNKPLRSFPVGLTGGARPRFPAQPEIPVGSNLVGPIITFGHGRTGVKPGKLANGSIGSTKIRESSKGSKEYGPRRERAVKSRNRGIYFQSEAQTRKKRAEFGHLERLETIPPFSPKRWSRPGDLVGLEANQQWV